MWSLIALSVWIEERTSSYALSGAVFGAHWLLPLLWPAGLTRLYRRLDRPARAAAAEWSAAVVVLPLAVAVLLGHPYAVLVLVSVRGFFEAITRATATLISADAARAGEVEPTVARLEFVRLLGTSAAGVLFALTQGVVALLVLLCLAGVAQLATGAAYRHLGPMGSTHAPAATRSRNSAPPLLDVIRKNPIASTALLQLGLIASFQGAHNAIRVPYPVEVLDQSLRGVGVVTAVSTLAVLVGGWVASRRPVLSRLAGATPAVMTACVAAALILAVAVTIPLPSYMAYFCFMLGFEITFMRLNVNVVKASTGECAATLIGIRSSVAGGGALIGLAVTALLIALLPVWPAVVVMSTMVAVAATSAQRLTRAAFTKESHALP